MTRRVGAELGFWVVALAPVVAVLVLPQLVVQDGGLHLSAATTLGQLLGGAFPDVVQARAGVPPNTLAELVLLGLLQVLEPGWALKVLVAAILLGFALAARSLVTAAGAAAPWAVLLLPFAWHRPLAWGFLGFAAAVVLALAAVAVVLRRPDRPPVVGLAVLLTLTWLTHLVPALVAVGVCGLAVLTAAVGRRQAGGVPAWGRSLGRVVLAAVPALVLTVVFTVLNPPGSSPPQTESLGQRVVGVLGMTRGEVSTVQPEYDAYRLVALVLYAVAATAVVLRLRAGWRVRPADALLVAAVLGTVGAVVAPEGVDGAGGFLGMRLSVFPALLLAGWVAGELGRVRRGPRLLPAVAVGVVLGVVAVGLVAVRYPAQHRYAALVDQIRELAPCLPERSTLVQLSLDDDREDAAQMYPLSEQVGFLAAERDGLDMGNESGWVPYYLWRYRDDQRPDLLLGTQPGGVFDVPPRIDLAGALAKGLRLDAVVVVGRPLAGPDVLDDGPTRRALADLAASYTRVRTSSGGAAELWLRTGTAPSC